MTGLPGVVQVLENCNNGPLSRGFQALPRERVRYGCRSSSVLTDLPLEVVQVVPWGELMIADAAWGVALHRNHSACTVMCA